MFVCVCFSHLWAGPFRVDPHTHTDTLTIYEVEHVQPMRTKGAPLTMEPHLAKRSKINKWVHSGTNICGAGGKCGHVSARCSYELGGRGTCNSGNLCLVITIPGNSEAQTTQFLVSWWVSINHSINRPFHKGRYCGRIELWCSLKTILQADDNVC